MTYRHISCISSEMKLRLQGCLEGGENEENGENEEKGKTRKGGKRGRPAIMNYCNGYRIVPDSE